MHRMGTRVGGGGVEDLRLAGQDYAVLCHLCKIWKSSYVMVAVVDDPVTGSQSYCYKCRACVVWHTFSKEERENTSLESLTEAYVTTLAKKGVEKEEEHALKGKGSEWGSATVPTGYADGWATVGTKRRGAGTKPRGAGSAKQRREQKRERENWRRLAAEEDHRTGKPKGRGSAKARRMLAKKREGYY